MEKILTISLSFAENVVYLHCLNIKWRKMKVMDRIIGFYKSIRQLDSWSVHDFRGRVKSWMKTGMLAARMFYVKDMWTKDVAALTFASFMALIPFMAMLFVIARGFGYTSLLESWISSTFASQPVVAKTIVNFVHNYIENTKGDYIIGTGIVMFLYTIISLMQKIELTFDGIWHAEERSWRKIITEYPTIFLGLGLMILFSSGVNVWLVNAVGTVGGSMGIGDAIPSVILHLAAFVPMFLSSYNVIYGSLAALPLFLLWLQISWAITVLGAILCNVIQNLHLYDGDVQYENLKLATRFKVCYLVMQLVCKRFSEGERAYTPREIHEVTKMPQQVVNGAVEELLKAGVLVEIKSKGKGSREETMRLHPIEKIEHLTYDTMVERLSNYGEDLKNK